MFGEMKSEIAGAAEIVSVWPEELISGVARDGRRPENAGQNLTAGKRSPNLFGMESFVSKRLAQGCPHGLNPDGDWV